MNVVYISASGQHSFTLSGKVLDEQNQALPDAYLFLNPSKKSSVTNDEGDFLIHGIQKGIYFLEISFVGYKTIADTIEINENKVYHVQMEPVLLNLQEVLVTDDYAKSRKEGESLSIEIVNSNYLEQNRAGSLMKSLERLPGVTSIDIGSGQSKPVIRGLGFNRVVVLEHGIKHEGQQWGVDHGLEIDQFAVEKLEVIKGPASLKYGSDAISGVIDLKPGKVPLKNSFGGAVDLIGKSNNELLGTSMSFFMRKNNLFINLRATLLDYGDYKVPTDSVDIYSYRVALKNNQLRNSAGEEKNIHLAFGIVQEQFDSRFFISHVTGKSGFFANAHGLELRRVDTEIYDQSSRDIQYPYHIVKHTKLMNKSQWKHDKYRIESELGFQRNFRQEWSQYVSHGYMPAIFPDTLDFESDLEREFEKYIYSGNLRSTFFINRNTTFSIGMNVSYQDNRIHGRGFIIPAFRQAAWGGFGLAKLALSEKSLLQFGVRYSYETIQTDPYFDWFPSPDESGDTTLHLQRAGELDRDFSNFSWSIGYNHQLKNLSVRANAGKSFRVPLAKELAANGVNYHRFSYEVGDPDLSPEISYQFDLGIDYSQGKFAMGVSPFLNYFLNYIYLNPTPEHDRLYGNGNQIYNYTESQVIRWGGEIHAHYELTNSLKLAAIGEYVYSRQLSGEKKGYTLPFSPPESLLLNLRYQKANFRYIKNAYAFLDYRLVASQTDIVPPEEMTESYQVVNLGLGGQIKIREQLLTISLQMRNLFNRRYFNHTSYYRLINVPDPGRNFILSISVPFSGEF